MSPQSPWPVLRVFLSCLGLIFPETDDIQLFNYYFVIILSVLKMYQLITKEENNVLVWAPHYMSHGD